MDKIFPEKIHNYFELIRLNKPIGFMLLLWPCWFSIAYLEFSEQYLLGYYIIFIIGSVIMRSAGCIINDLIDQDIDSKIERTATRPLASKKITNFNAIIFLFVLLVIGLLILLQFKTETVLVGFLCTPLIVLYPLMKRITFWPQLFLGIIFNWGVIICSVEFYGTITKEYLILYLACVLWTIGYDTIYAYQDLTDDKKNSIKSTAVLFEDNGKYLVITSYALMLIMIGYLTLHQTFEILKLLVYLCIFIYIIANILKWDHKSEQNSGKKFRQNNVFGAIIFLYLLSF
ncbi:MAG: 4-hydroxybenzoate octaprenyltransferase [Proteobacteria bacterium]|nr:4-hydroxybenzoate octaprenyltransferase [Pseudomonadota bacterium]MDA1181101.1 4-hydroxybenzoate octaprenyltransferase [Pseudomonadota bacterium]